MIAQTLDLFKKIPVAIEFWKREEEGKHIRNAGQFRNKNQTSNPIIQVVGSLDVTGTQISQHKITSCVLPSLCFLIH